MTSSRRTSTPASTPASASRASTPRSCPASGSSRSGPLGPLDVSDQLWVARWLLYRIAEDFGVVGHARPEAGQGRLERRRRAHQLLDQGDARGLRRRSSPRARRSARRPSEHVANYGAGIEHRLTGTHETAPWNEFSYGVSDRGASVRIPWQVENDRQGLHRGPASERQHGPVRGDPADRRHRAAAPWPERAASTRHGSRRSRPGSPGRVRRALVVRTTRAHGGSRGDSRVTC